MQTLGDDVRQVPTIGGADEIRCDVSQQVIETRPPIGAAPLPRNRYRRIGAGVHDDGTNNNLDATSGAGMTDGFAPELSARLSAATARRVANARSRVVSRASATRLRSASLLADVHALVEHHDTAISNRLECGDVAAIEMNRQGHSRVRSGELNLGARTGAKSRRGFDERRLRADVEECDRLTRTKDGE